MKRVVSLLASSMPFIIIAGLLYASFFIKPQPGGSVLKMPQFERGDHFYGLAMPESRVIWMVGGGGKIFRSEDGAESWVRQVSGTHMALQDVAAWDGKRAVAVGNERVVIVTSDGGLSWHPADISSQNLTGRKWLRVRALPNGEAWVVGEGGAAFRSADFGQHWERLGAVEDVAWNDVQFRDGHVLLVGEFGRIKSSSDSGKTWISTKSPVETSLMGVAFRNSNNAVAVGLGGVILSSQDGGKTWKQEQSPSQEHLYSVIWDGDRWVAVGDKGIAVILSVDGTSMVTQVVPGNRSWYTAIISSGERYFLAGATFAIVGKNIASSNVITASRGSAQ
ncbi:MAG: hypothetical protein RugAbin2_00807 [Rugosibacter sp.]|nr:hypothetical protein [Rugosibacter sp.]